MVLNLLNVFFVCLCSDIIIFMETKFNSMRIKCDMNPYRILAEDSVHSTELTQFIRIKLFSGFIRHIFTAFNGHSVFFTLDNLIRCGINATYELGLRICVSNLIGVGLCWKTFTWSSCKIKNKGILMKIRHNKVSDYELLNIFLSIIFINI